MTLDWDGRIRMDPSSAYAMQRLIGLKDRFDIAFACDTDHDRHGIVTPSGGLMPPNHYLSVAIDYLFQQPRRSGSAMPAVGKTVVSSAMIDRVAARLGRRLYEVPVGFKWFVDGLFDGSLGFGGEESAGASVPAPRRHASGRPTRTASCRRCCRRKSPRAAAAIPASSIAISCRELGDAGRRPRRGAGQRRSRSKRSRSSSPPQVHADTELAGEQDRQVLDRAPGNDAPIGGIKVIAASGWFAARPSGTEDIYKIYAESFRGQEHCRRSCEEAQDIVDRALAKAERDIDEFAPALAIAHAITKEHDACPTHSTNNASTPCASCRWTWCRKRRAAIPGMPLGAAPMAYVLWTRLLKHNPRNPHWFDRDRFVLSAGHGSTLLYSLLHLTGYDLSLDDIKQFRQWGSKAPGHPERGHTPGVEVTTGPARAGLRQRGRHGDRRSAARRALQPAGTSP